MNALVETQPSMSEESQNERAVPGVKLLHAALHEHNGTVIIQGIVSPESLRHLNADDYQREILRPVTLNKKHTKSGGGPLHQAVAAGKRLPYVELGMRGQRFTSRGSTFILQDDVYIIDGLQRISTVRDYNELHPDELTKTQIGAVVHIDTTKEWEKERFADLNTGRTPMSPNILLRNLRDKSPAVLTLYGLSNDKTFVLYGRVSWKQNMSRGNLITAQIMARTAYALHRHVPGTVIRTTSGPPNGSGSAGSKTLAGYLDSIAEVLGLRHFRDNTRKFFELVDEVYGLRVIEYRELAVQTKAIFLVTLASVMSSHNNFWKNGAGQALQLDADMKRRLKSFPLHDPTVERLASAGNSAVPLLFNLLVDHLNKGRSRNRLQERK